MNVIEPLVLIGKQFMLPIGTALEMELAAQRADGTPCSYDRPRKKKAIKPLPDIWAVYDMPLYKNLPIEWPDIFIEALHIGLLEESLETLRTCSNIETNEDYKDIVAWIFKPKLKESIRVPEADGSISTVYRPFCFTQCCKVLGLDPAELKHQLLPILEKQRERFEQKLQRRAAAAGKPKTNS
jgi:hypothetical protein